MKKYTYAEAIDFFKNMPHFTPPKEGTSPAKDLFSLDAELTLLEKLGRPQDKLKYVHIAGTNGKGSTTAYLESILNEASVVTGAFTSPFLYRYNEMFKVNGQDISDQDFADTFSLVKEKYDELVGKEIFPSEYEILTVMAFVYFIKKGCSLVLMEVSLGGRVDTTNVIPSPELTVITPISYDHMTILGHTLTEIATEKAGIIKNGSRVVSASQEEEVVSVLEKVCKSKEVEIAFVDKALCIERNIKGQRFILPGEDKEFVTGLLGIYQIDNGALAIRAARILRTKGFDISEESIQRGIEKASWFGRFTLVNERPIVIVDGGHNRQGAKVLKDSLEAYFPGRKILFALGILKDKEVDLILDALLPIAKEVYTMDVPSARTMKKEELSLMIRSRGVKSSTIEKLEDINDTIGPDEILCIAGSLYLISEIKRGKRQ
ncbi:MAG: bifunctional folylpolyglutamate synthase/dihydrofolate synthase [Pseudobutyrivibrio sp.]|nr:bifunctional folylpolyglutamate synthase/dihydrofolate synthase [Pseudobutyrivibrio sp.]